jgi:4-amino-4-deoxy-L-arabinose transferase-like glycosyltransferase
MFRSIKLPPLAAVLFLCGAIRLGILLAFPSIFAFEQTGAFHGIQDYDTHAVNLLATGAYGAVPGISDADLPPVYGYALAAVYAVFGRGHLQVGLFHIALDMLSIVLLYQIGRRLMPHGDRVAWLAGLFYAVYPYLIFQNLTLVDTPIFMTLLYAFVLTMVLLRERPTLDRLTWGLAILGGLALGLGALSRAIIAPLAVFVAIWFLFRLNVLQTVVRLLPVAIVSIMMLIPWIAHNYRGYGGFVAVATNAGGNFWYGNNAFTVPLLRNGYHPQWIAPAEDMSAYDALQKSQRLFALGYQYLGEDPGRIPELLWVKFLTHWSVDVFPSKNPVSGAQPIVDYKGAVHWSNDAQGTMQFDGLPQNDPVAAYSEPLFDRIGRIVHRFYFGGMLLLALIGIALTWRQWRQVALLWFVQISMTLMYVLFIPATRYRVPTDPLLFLFSAHTLIVVWDYFHARRESAARGRSLGQAESGQA